MDFSITPLGCEASRIASLLLCSVCLFSSQKINEHALIQECVCVCGCLGGGGGHNPDGFLTKTAKMGNKRARTAIQTKCKAAPCFMKLGYAVISLVISLNLQRNSNPVWETPEYICEFVWKAIWLLYTSTKSQIITWQQWHFKLLNGV